MTVGLLVASLVLSLIAFNWRIDERFRLSKTDGWSRLVFAVPIAAIAIPSLGNFFSVNGGLPLVGNSLLFAQLTPILALAALGAFGLLSGGRPTVAWLLCVFVVVIAIVTAEARGQALSQSLIMLAAVVGLASIPRRPDGFDAVIAGSRLAFVLVIAGLAVMVAALPGTSLSECRADKCSFLIGETLTIGDSGNVIGLYLLALLPFVMWRLSLPRMFAVAVAFGILLDLSSGRSAMVGAALSFATLLILRIVRDRSAMARRWVALPVIVATALSFVPIFAVVGESDFTFRGSLWNYARELVSTSPVFGYGPAYWSGQPPISTITYNYSPHSVWLELLVSIGLIGAIAVAGMLIAVLGKVDRSRLPLFLAAVAGLLGAGMLEATITPYRPSILMAAMPILLLLVAHSQAQSAGSSERAEVASPDHRSRILRADDHERSRTGRS